MHLLYCKAHPLAVGVGPDGSKRKPPPLMGSKLPTFGGVVFRPLDQTLARFVLVRESNP